MKPTKKVPKMPQLPQEVIDMIAFYLPFEKAVAISEHMKEKLGEKPDWKIYADEGNLFGIKWMHYHELGGCRRDTMDYAAGICCRERPLGFS